METDLYNYQCKNISTYLSYYSSVNKRAENYYFFIKDYKKYTSTYLNSIQSLLNSFTPSFNKSKDNITIRISDDDITLIDENKLDLSPLDKITSKIYKEFQEQIKALNFFLKNIELTLDNYKEILNQTKLDVENLKNKYIPLKNKFIETISSIKNENEILIKDISNIEDELIKYYFFTKKLKNSNINYNKEENEENLQTKIQEIKEREDDFMKKENNKLNIFNDFNKDIESYNNQIKSNTFFLIKIFKLSISSFSKYFLDFFNLDKEKKITTLKIQKDNKKHDFKEFELCINKNLKLINDNTINTSLIQTKKKYYIPKILKTETNNVVNYILDLFQKGEFNINIDDIYINQNDTLYIMEQLSVFKLLDKDIYNIEKEKNKIIIIEMVKNIFILKEDEKYLEEESIKLFKFIETDGEYRTQFLLVLGNERSNTNIELTNKLFDIFSKIFSFLADIILKEKDYYTEDNLLILSQTFYKLDNGNKIYLCDTFKKHKLFADEENWIEYIKLKISIDVKNKFSTDSSLPDKKELNQKSFDKSINEIIFTQIISANQSMKNLELDDDKIVNIINDLFKYFTKLTPDVKNQIMKFIKG